jgi:predicted ATPase/class 3 adenylate cyclase
VRETSSADRSRRPTGTVTFLFTDIEGSTQRWDRKREAMQRAVRRHDAILRAAIDSNGGLVFKTIGDAFCAAFESAEEGVAAALAAQRTLAIEDFSEVDGLQVRMALHTGTADERDDDYYGPAVNRVARLLSIGHGGQVLTSGITADLVRPLLPDGVELRAMGRHHLKNISEPERVHQLLAADLRREFPALRSIDSRPNNLPRQLTSFVGRDRELAELTRLLQEEPLVTLAGPGGIGKTRLALQTGAALLERFRDGVWFAEFAPISESAVVPNLIAAAVGVQESVHEPMIETLVSFLKTKEMLLILDNCEHVIAGAASTVEAIVRDCPAVKILATSREGLRIGGERVVRIPSLPVAGSVALFADRAASVNAQFVLTDANEPAIAEICRRLDGIALAIELAAARVKVFSVTTIAEKLDERFRILTGGTRTALPRQQTLRALLDWSYDLLSEEESKLFRTLAIFAGDFSLDSAAAVWAGYGIEIDAFDLVASLVDKSLLQTECCGDEIRYRLLESTREYARGRLIESDEFEDAARAHSTVYLELAERLEATYDATPDPVWNARVEPEIENWRTSLQWAHGERGDIALGQRLSAALRPVWFTMAPSEGRRWIDVGLKAANAETPVNVVARLELCEAHLAMLCLQYKVASSAAERAGVAFAELGDANGVALAQLFAGAARGQSGDAEAGETLLKSALEVFRRLDARRSIGAALVYLAGARLNAGDVAGSRPLFSEALDVLRNVGATRPAAQVAQALAEAEYRGGNIEAAIRLAQEALDTAREQHDRDSATVDLCNLSAYLVACDRWAEAARCGREALALAREGQFTAAIAYALQHIAAVAALRPAMAESAPEERRRAALLVGFVDARFADLDIRREFTEQVEYERSMASLDASLGRAECRELRAEGRCLSEELAIAEGLAI